MSKLDDELRKAVLDSEAKARPDDALSSVEAPARDVHQDRGTKRNLGLLLGLFALGGGVIAFVLGQDGKQLVYAKQVDQVLANREELKSRNLRVQGVLVHGSLIKRDQPCEFRFKVRPKENPEGGQLEVHYESCIVPDTFRDVAGMDVEVTAEGQLSGEHLAATQIFAKCPSKYEMQQRQAAGETAPHGGGAPAVNPMNGIPGDSKNVADPAKAL
jgi:cytochrome c-type biogenesis protein CcmE